MKRLFFPTLLVIILLSGCGKNKFKRSEFLQDLYDQKIWPDLLETENRVAGFSSGWDAYKASPGATQLTDLKVKFSDCLYSFEKIAFYNLGDISTVSVYNGAYKTSVDTVTLWDKYGAATFFTSTTIQGYTTKEKGIFTLEYLLYASSFQDSMSSPKFVQFMTAQVETLEENFAAIKTAWSTYEKNFVSADDEGVEGSYNIVINRVIHQLEDIIDKRINDPLNAGDLSVAVAFRSDNAWKNIKEMVSQLNSIYLGKGTEEFNSIYNSVRRKNKKLADQISEAFDQVISTGDSMTKSMSYYLSTGSAELVSYKEMLKEILVYFKLDVVKELDIVLTFGDNDGD